MTDTNIAELRYDKVIDLTKERFCKMAPNTISFEAEKGYAVQLLENNDYLMKAAMENKGSLLQAITNVAAIGLSLNPAKKQAYLIPRNVKVKIDGQDQWITKVFLEPSYMGLCDLATMSGSIMWVQSQIVYANDDFTDNGPGEKPTHSYNSFAKVKDRGEFVGVYCVAKTSEGDYLTTTMTAEEIYSVRERSELWKKYKSGPWKTDFAEQAKKTVVRRAFKMWPKTDTLERMETAIHLSNENEGFEPILTSPSISNYTADQKAYFDQLISNSDAVGMYAFIRSIEEGVYINLYHSFEKGQKGKYQQIVRDLMDEGAAKITEYISVIEESTTSGDDSAIAELLDGEDESVISHLKDNCSKEAASAIDAVLEELKGEDNADTSGE